jgi:hypothetical protein
MEGLRIFFRRHRALAALLVTLALAMKVLVPAGTMIDAQASTLTVEICDGVDHHLVSQVTLPPSGKSTGDKTRHDGVCPFSALGHAGLAGADPLQLALALAFIVALGLAPLTPPRGARAVRLRPPLRGPPALS